MYFTSLFSQCTSASRRVWPFLFISTLNSSLSASRLDFRQETKTPQEYLVTVIGSDNIRFPFLTPTTSGLACSLQGARGSEGVYSVGVLASSQADHLMTCVKLPACDWAAARESTLPYIATLPLVTLDWLRNMTLSLAIIDYPYE